MADAGTLSDYLRRIEETFIGLRGTPFVLSPSDVQLILSWFEREVPSDVVEEAVREVFQREQARDPDRKICSLKYCSYHVEMRWKERQKRRAGTWHREGEALDVPFLLRRNKERLAGFLESGAWPAPAGKKGPAWLKDVEALMEKAQDVEAVEAGLKNLQDTVAAAVWAALSKAERAARENEVRKKLAKDLAPLSAQAQKLLLRTLVLSDLMEEFNLPRLTLLE